MFGSFYLPTAHFLSYLALRVAGLLEPIAATLGRRWGTSWTSWQFISTQRDNQPSTLTFTLTDILVCP